MPYKRINKNFHLLLIVVLAVSLTSLGIRFPSGAGISSAGKPKPRPRAIIKNQIETCKQIIKQVSSAIALNDSCQIDYPSWSSLHPLPELNCRYTVASVTHKLSRAPPSYS